MVQEQGRDISPLEISHEEKELACSDTVEGNLYRLLLVLHETQLGITRSIDDIYHEAQSRVYMIDNEYRGVIDPKNITEVGILKSANKLQELAFQINNAQDEAQAWKEMLSQEETLASINFPLLKQAIMGVWRQTNGTPMKPEFLTALQSHPTADLEIAAQVIKEVVAQDLDEEKVMPVVTQSFDSWEDVILDPNVLNDNAEIVGNRNALIALMRTKEAEASQYLIEGKRMNLLGGIDIIDTITVEDFNKAFNPNNSKTISSATRILSLAHRLIYKDTNIYYPPSSFRELAYAIRSGEFSGTDKILEIAYLYENPTENTPPAPQAPTESKRIPETKRKRGYPHTEAGIVNFMVEAMRVLHRDPSANYDWPVNTATFQSLYRKLESDFVDDMYKKHFVAPQEYHKSGGYAYTEVDVIKLMALKKFQKLRSAPPNVVRSVLKRYEVLYQDAKKAFSSSD